MKTTTTFLLLVSLLLIIPGGLAAQNGGGSGGDDCGDCHECTGMNYYKVLKHGHEEEYVYMGGDCVFSAVGCQGLFECQGNETEDADVVPVEFADVRLFEDALRDADESSLETLVSRFGDQLRVDRLGGAAMLLGGCSGEMLIASMPIQDPVVMALVDLQTPDH